MGKTGVVVGEPKAAFGTELGSDTDVFKVLIEGRRQKTTVTRKQFTFQDDTQHEPEAIAATPATAQGKDRTHREGTTTLKGKAQRGKGGGGKRRKVSPAHSAGKGAAPSLAPEVSGKKVALASCASSPTTVLTPEDDEQESDKNERSGKECKPTIASSSDEEGTRKRLKKPPSDGGKGGKRPRKRVVESDSSDDSVAQSAAGVPIK